MNEFVTLAKRLADEAGKIVKRYYRQPFDVISKEDESPVTIADRKVEQRMREILEDARPQDGIYGEEHGVKTGESGLTWVLDPIDGTKSFVIGRPTFGMLIALCEDGAPVLGVIDQPILGERWIGDGQQTLFNGKAVQCAPCSSIDTARIGSTTPAMFETTGPVYKNFNEGRFFWGGDCYQYGLMACGFVDIILEANMKPYDYAALAPIVQGAGGHISDFNGKPLTLESDGTVVACGDPALWPKIQKRLST
ncbi:MAG: histidinol phosphate phosphatase [Alphaproteobacteria bacterium]|nr:histidinol phosphate phosphatase [Alphaproteobacteria bacterium]